MFQQVDSISTPTEHSEQEPISALADINADIEVLVHKQTVHKQHVYVPAGYTPPVNFEPVTNLNTALFDSIAIDTVPGHYRFATSEQIRELRQQQVADSIAAAKIAHTGRAEGIEPRHLTPIPDGGQGVTALMMGALILVGFSGKSVIRAMRTYGTDLVAVRGRENAFNDNRPVPVMVSMLMVALFIIFGGIALCNLPCFAGMHSFGQIMSAMGILGAYYVFELVAYNLVGYAFTTPEMSRSWLGGFAASQAFTAIAIIVPTMLAVCMPQWSKVCIYICISIYFILRCMFIFKGFRIFYLQIGSLLYFFLYLCALEIVPVLSIYVILSHLLG